MEDVKTRDSVDRSTEFFAKRTGNVAGILLVAGFITDWSVFRYEPALSVFLWSVIICAICCMALVIRRSFRNTSR